MLLWNMLILVMFSARIQDHVLLAQNTLDYSNSSANITNDSNANNKGKPGIVILYSKHSTKDDVKMKETTFVTRDRTVHESISGMFKSRNSEPPLLPRIAPGMPTEPSCARGGNFCLHHVDYPLEVVQSVVSRHDGEFSSLFRQVHPYPANDYIAHDNYTLSYRTNKHQNPLFPMVFSEWNLYRRALGIVGFGAWCLVGFQFCSTDIQRRKGHFVCESELQYIQPGWAKNWKNQWMLVVNTEKYQQYVKLETCTFQGKKCEYLPPCYKSICVQRFTPVKLLCIDPTNLNGKPVIDVFDVPNVCSCFVENFIYY